MSKIAFYIRLSLQDKDKVDESESVRNQRSIIKSYVSLKDDLKNRKYTEYVDDGFSGTSIKRPAFNRLMKDIKNLEIDTIIVKDLSRFMRDYIAMGDYLENIFPFMGVRFIAINDGYDSSLEKGNGTNIDIQFKNLLHEFYARDASEKVRSVCNSLKSQGKHLGLCPFGYMRDKEDKHKILVDPVAAPIVKRIFNLYIDGYSLEKIASLFNAENVITPKERKTQHKNENEEDFNTIKVKRGWTTSTLYSLLNNENFTGTYCYNMKITSTIDKINKVLPSSKWKRVYNNHEAIISKELFNKVQEKRKKNPKFKKINPNRPQNPIKDYLYCKSCENKLRYKYRELKKGGYQAYFYCKTCKLLNGTSKWHRDTKLVDATVNNLDIMGMKEEKSYTKNSDNLKSEKKTNTKDEISKIIEKLEEEKDMAFLKYKNGKLAREKYIDIKNNIENKIKESKIIIPTKNISTCENQNYLNKDKLKKETLERYVKKIMVDEKCEIEIIRKDFV